MTGFLGVAGGDLNVGSGPGFQGDVGNDKELSQEAPVLLQNGGGYAICGDGKNEDGLE